METTASPLKQKYETYKAANPKKRIRDIATDLNVSEAELLATGLGDTVTLLKGNLEDVVKQVPTLGYVMALTRNEYCVSERKGQYGKISFTPHAGLVLGEDIDLRLFMYRWKLAFAVNENGRRSLQFFDGSGMALHKIYLTDKSDEAAYNKLVADFADNDATNITVDQTTKPVAAVVPDDEIDIAGFQQAWLDMKDSHEFIILLRKHNLARTQALRLAPQGYARQVSANVFKKACEQCAEKQVQVMIFVANPGCIQIHSGHINKLVTMGPWYNVLDPEFNLHLREDAIVSAWHVIKPSTDGDVNSIELFDADGTMILQIFGKRKPGVPELSEWREVIAEVVK